MFRATRYKSLTFRLRPNLRPSLVAALLLALSALFNATESLAQAWLPTKGELDTTLGYVNILNQKHYLPSGKELDVGSTRSETETLKVLYGITDRLTLSGGIPFVTAWYHGDHPHPGFIDNGDKHGSLTDLRLGLHYQVSEGPIAFAPYIQYSFPVKDYETFGHSATGRGLDELWLGFYAGRNLDRWLPRAYVQLRYNYAFVEKVVGIKHDRSNAEMELGYRLTPRWTARGVILFQDSYGGIDVPIPPTDPLYPHHDQLAAEDSVSLGGGASWAPSLHNTFHLFYLQSIRGTNGHKVDQNLSLGWTWSYIPQ
jgi:hypothetical protein